MSTVGETGLSPVGSVVSRGREHAQNAIQNQRRRDDRQGRPNSPHPPVPDGRHRAHVRRSAALHQVGSVARPPPARNGRVGARHRGTRRARRRAVDLPTALGPRGQGGGRPPRPRHRPRRSGRHPPAQRKRLGARLLRHPDARCGRRSGEHSLHRERDRVRRHRLGRLVRLRARRSASRRRPGRRRRPQPQGPGCDLLHERHDRVPQGRDDDPRELPVELRDVQSRDRVHEKTTSGTSSRCRCSTSRGATAS